MNIIETKPRRWLSDAILIAACVVGGLVWLAFFWLVFAVAKGML